MKLAISASERPQTLVRFRPRGHRDRLFRW